MNELERKGLMYLGRSSIESAQRRLKLALKPKAKGRTEEQNCLSIISLLQQTITDCEEAIEHVNNFNQARDKVEN